MNDNGFHRGESAGPVLLLGGVMLSCLLGLSCERTPKTVIHYRADLELKTLEAPVGGTWSLYAADDTTPRFEVTIAAGTRIGFEMDDKSGKLLAVAGEMARALPAREAGYYWTHE